MAWKKKRSGSRGRSQSRAPRSGPPRHWAWAQLLDTTDSGSGCANAPPHAPSGCVNRILLDLVQPSSHLGDPSFPFPAPMETVTLRALEVDLWFTPDLSTTDCGASDITLEIRAGLYKTQTTSGNPEGLIPAFFTDGGFNDGDFWTFPMVHRWHHSWERLEDCEEGTTTPNPDAPGLVSLDTKLNGFLPCTSGDLVEGTGTIGCELFCLATPDPSGLCASIDAVTTGSIATTGSFYTSVIGRDKAAWHLRLRSRRKLLFKPTEGLQLQVAFSDPFGQGQPAPSMNFYGGARGLVSLG